MIKHQLIKVPKQIKKQTASITIIEIITSIGFDLLSFFLQFSKNQIASGNIILGIVFIMIYYTQQMLESSISLMTSNIRETYEENCNKSINNIAVSLILKVRGKVWRINSLTNSREKMASSSLLRVSRSYIYFMWKLKLLLPKNIIQSISVFCMFIGFIAVTTVEIEHTFLFVLIILIVSVLSILFSIKRNKVKKRFKEKRKEILDKEDITLNDILNIEPINSKHSKYMTDKYMSVNKEKYSINKMDKKALNKLNLIESVMDSLATIIIIIIKIAEVGLGNVDLQVLLSIIALVSIYTQIMHRVNSILNIVEKNRETYENLKTYESDFFEIIQVYDEEVTKTTKDYGITKEVIVPYFEVTYKAQEGNTTYCLKNTENIVLRKGDIVLLEGPTGSGKSTFMRMILGITDFTGFELYYKRERNGSINTLMHQTDGRLGYSDVLSEITLDEQLDKDKLIHILIGLHLYEEIKEKSEDVLSYIKNTSADDYSTGQKQRLAIARLLYNMDDSIQIIGFDEATNALNDEITIQTLNFIREFCKDKILLIATHQLPIGRTVANKRLKFEPKQECYEITQTQ